MALPIFIAAFFTFSIYYLRSCTSLWVKLLASLVLRFYIAVSISSISAYYNFDRCSYKLLSVLNMVESASFFTSTNSLLNLSSFLNFSALFIISLISYSLKPPELYIWIEWSLFVALSFAETCTIPLASMSNVTSI